MRKHALLGIFIALILFYSPGVSAEVSSLEGETIKYSYVENTDLTSYDQVFEDSVRNDVSISVEFSDTSSTNSIMAKTSYELDDIKYWDYRYGYYSIEGYIFDYDVTDTENVTLTDDHPFDLFMDLVEYPLVAINTTAYIDYLIEKEQAINDQYGSELENIDRDDLSVSYEYEYDRDLSSYLPRDEEGNLTVKGSFSMKFESNGLVKELTTNMEYIWDGITLISSEKKLRSGVFRNLATPFPSMVFFGLALAVISTIRKKRSL